MVLTLLFAAPLAAPQEAQRRGNQVDYKISARLEEKAGLLTGRETITWTNGGPDRVSDAWFHLYLNAFANNRSTHLVESGGKLRDDEMKEGFGWSRVTSIAAVDLASGASIDLLPTFSYERPDDGNEEDRTVFSVVLPEPVPPGGSAVLEVTWQCQLPRVRRRTGYKDGFLLVAQWFPKLGVYEAGRGWNCHQFHRDTEFFSDYGTYEVELDLPPEYHGKVFGTGLLGSQQIKLGRNIATFFAPSKLDRARPDVFGLTPLVHDFTWTADPRFLVETRTFEPSVWMERYPDEVERARAALGDEALSLRRVDVTTLIHPERAEQADRHFEATCAALFFYGLWFGEYPYEHITVVDPPWGGEGAGGMEYPTLFTCGTRLFTEPDNHSPESVTVHECGHQFWYGLVGNNEFEAAWLDEGFNTFTDAEVLARVYGARRDTTRYAAIPVDGTPLASVEAEGELGRALSLRKLPAPLGIPFEPVRGSGFLDWWRDQPALTFVPQLTDPRWDDRSGYLRDPDSAPIDTVAFQYVDRTSYRTNSYPRTAVALRTLQFIVGEDAFLRGMRHYAKTWRYRHPYPDDFFASFQEGAGVDCGWYFDEVFRSTQTGDWAVEVTQERRRPDRGLFQGEGGEFLERPELEAAADDAPAAPWETEVLLRKRGGLALPMPLRLAFDDGSVQDVTWTREEQLEQPWKRLEFEGDAKLVSARLDPDRRIYLDANLANNAWYAKVDRAAPWRFGERVLAQMQHYLHLIGGIGG